MTVICLMKASTFQIENSSKNKLVDDVEPKFEDLQNRRNFRKHHPVESQEKEEETTIDANYDSQSEEYIIDSEEENQYNESVEGEFSTKKIYLF